MSLNFINIKQLILNDGLFQESFHWTTNKHVRVANLIIIAYKRDFLLSRSFTNITYIVGSS